MSYQTLNHPTLGSIRGISKLPDVHQYLGIQYATLKDRFSRGELVQSYPARDSEGVLDATEFGPLPLHSFEGCAFEYEIYIQRQPPPIPYLERQSDTECLTLNITAPNTNDSRRHPVLVFLHGGAFMTGSSSFPQCDMGRITKLSLEMGYPIIAVGVNYRVGAPGFLHSSVMADVGYKANNGLDDQRLALRWVQKHITGFGGDPAKVTLLGESAGATAGAFHLQSPEPLFQQLIAMSGSLAQPFQSAERGGDRPFSMIADALGGKELSPKQQLQRILDTPKEEFVSTVGRRLPIRPLVDGDTIRVSTTFKLLTDPDEVLKFYSGIQHCRRVMMGDCQMDGMAFYSRLAGRIDILPKTLANILSTVFDPINTKIAPTLISAYALDTNAVSNTLQTTLPILNFGNDIMFSLPAHAFARAWSHSRSPVNGTESFLCHFNCPNPWDGRWKGYATHVLDLNFVLQNFREDLSRGQRESAERYARDIIAFVHGESPWDAYEVDARPGSTVYYAPVDGEQDGSRFVPDEESESTGRRDIFQKVVGEALFDKLVDVWQLFMAGPRK